MKIKKIDEETIYRKETKEYLLELENGKKVRVYKHFGYDNISDYYDNDYDIDEKDKETLTDEELEMIEENMLDIFKLELKEELIMI